MRKGTSGLASMLPLSIALAFGLMVSPQAIVTANASVEYPWCAVYSEAIVGATNCGFTTLAQCRATISGVGGTCQPNPAYTPPARTDRKTRKPRP